MKKKLKTFNAKILLFGEYTVILDSKALTIPYTYFNGHLSFIGENKYTKYDLAQKSNKELLSYLNHLSSDNTGIIEQIGLRLDEFEMDLKNGLYFESNIPQGYGVGSSGALVAALYTRYVSSRIKESDLDSILELRNIFSAMESFFHGRSSGMDPLNCYIGAPLLISSSRDIKIVDVPIRNNNADGAIFLIDSGYPGETEPLVKLFLSKVKENSYRQAIYEQFVPLNNQCIDLITQGDIDEFFQSLKELSRLQLQYFTEMIPGNLINIWEEGLHSGEYSLKLCGSGGGGFLLGFTRDYIRTESILKQKGIDLIPVFKHQGFRD
jgi:mevalonate kinase